MATPHAAAFPHSQRARPALAHRASGLVGSVIDSSTSLLQRQTHDIVSFAMGSPADEAIPTALLGELGDQVLANVGPAAFGYAATEGDPALRAALLRYLDTTEERTTPERLLVTSGGMQGLDLVGKLFIDPGDLVFVEGPTYPNGTATLLAYGAEIVEIPIDAGGMIVESLPEYVERAGRTPKAIYVIPNFQNPSGTALSLERRLFLLELARQWNSVIIDDDPYGPLRFEGEAIPGFRALGAGDPHVISVRTFSKILAPGLRVGWVDAAPEIIARMVDAKQTMDTCTTVPSQMLVAAFLDSGHLDSHLDFLRAQYLERKQTMQAVLAREFGARAEWTNPHGGFFLWLTLHDAIDTTALFPRALEAGVAYIPGSAFSLGDGFSRSLRLCFASTGPERTIEGIRRLRAVIDEASGRAACADEPVAAAPITPFGSDENGFRR